MLLTHTVPTMIKRYSDIEILQKNKTYFAIVRPLALIEYI